MGKGYLKSSSVSRSPMDLDGVPELSRAIPLSLQHVISIVVAVASMSIIVGTEAGVQGGDLTLLVQTSLIFAGLTTILQAYPLGKFGARLPVIYGAGFTFLPVYMAIAHKGMGVLMGAQILGGLITILAGFSIYKIRRFFPPLVTGTIVLSIGLSLYPIAINYMAGGIGSPTYGSMINWLVALVSLLVAIVCSNHGRGMVKTAAVLIGMFVGYILSLALNLVDFSPFYGAGIIAIPKPLYFGLEFDPTTILPVFMIFLVNSLQSVGDLSALTAGGLNREIEDEELSGGLMGCGLMTCISSIFGGMPTSSYSENVGMVCFNKVVSRFVVATAGLIIVIAGIFPKISGIFSTIPYPVIGGATMSIFGMITMTGMKLITEGGLDQRKVFIVGISIAFGMGIYMVPESAVYFPGWMEDIFTNSPVVLSGLIVFFLNLITPGGDHVEIE